MAIDSMLGKQPRSCWHVFAETAQKSSSACYGSERRVLPSTHGARVGPCWKTYNRESAGA
jgi:hypothetical protein